MEQDIFPNIMIYYINFNHIFGPWRRKQTKKCFILQLWPGINGTERCTTSLKELDLAQDLLLPVGTILFFTFLPSSEIFLPGNQHIKSPATSRNHTGLLIYTDAGLRL